VLRRALEAQDAEESWTDEERQALAAHIEQGYLQAERGELIDGAQARRGKMRVMAKGATIPATSAHSKSTKREASLS
jgi:hypothetical protein